MRPSLKYSRLAHSFLRIRSSMHSILNKFSKINLKSTEPPLLSVNRIRQSKKRHSQPSEVKSLNANEVNQTIKLLSDSEEMTGLDVKRLEDLNSVVKLDNRIKTPLNLLKMKLDRNYKGLLDPGFRNQMKRLKRVAILAHSKVDCKVKASQDNSLKIEELPQIVQNRPT